MRTTVLYLAFAASFLILFYNGMIGAGICTDYLIHGKPFGNYSLSDAPHYFAWAAGGLLGMFVTMAIGCYVHYDEYRRIKDHNREMERRAGMPVD